MVNASFSRQMVIGMGTSMTSALVSAFIVFFLLVMRKRLKDKQNMLRIIQRMQQSVPFRRRRSHSSQSAISASGYSAGFRGASGAARNMDDVQYGRQLRKVPAYHGGSFSHPYAEGASTSAIMDPWDHVLPGRGRPLHSTHDPFHGRSRGQDRTAHRESMSSAPPSEGHPAVSAFRPSKFPATPTTFYTYDGRIANTLNSYQDDSVLTPTRYYDTRNSNRDHSKQGHKDHQGQGQAKRDRDGRTYYYGRQHSNQSLDSGLRELGASTSNNNLHTPKKHHYRKKERTGGDSNFQWHSTPIRQSSREQRQCKPSLPRTNLSLRRSSLDNTPSPKESLSWAGVHPYWRSEMHSEMSSKRRSGSYDELETRHRKRYDSSGDVDDDLAVFNWLPNRGPVTISLDHHPSSTYDGDVNLEAKAESDDSLSRISSEHDHDSALYSMEDLPKFTKSTAKLELSGEGGGEDNEAL